MRKIRLPLYDGSNGTSERIGNVVIWGEANLEKLRLCLLAADFDIHL